MTKPEFQSVGGVETSSMARGFAVTDAMLKAADVKLLVSRTVCPGKFIALVTGRVADVAASVAAGASAAAESLVDQFAIPNIDPDIFPAIEGTTQVSELEALGIIETFSVASLIEAADAAVKAASVRLIEIKLAMAMGGGPCTARQRIAGSAWVKTAGGPAGQKGRHPQACQNSRERFNRRSGGYCKTLPLSTAEVTILKKHEMNI